MMSPPCSMDGYAAARRPPVVGAAGMRAAVLRNARARRGVPAAGTPVLRRSPVPRLVGRGEGRVALAQVVVADLAGAAHVVVGEVDRVQVHLVGHVLVPVQAARRRPGSWTRPGGAAPRIPRRRRASPGCCSSPWCSAIASCMAMGARAQREMHRAQRVAQQHDVLVRPAFVAHDVRLEPQRAIAQQLVGAQVLAEHFGAVAPAVVRWPCPGRRGASCPDPPRPGRCSGPCCTGSCGR